MPDEVGLADEVAVADEVGVTAKWLAEAVNTSGFMSGSRTRVMSARLVGALEETGVMSEMAAVVPDGTAVISALLGTEEVMGCVPVKELGLGLGLVSSFSK